MINVTNPESLVWGGKRGETGDCLTENCRTSFDLGVQDTYYFVSNWDRNNPFTINLTATSTAGVMTWAKYLTISSSILLLTLSLQL